MDEIKIYLDEIITKTDSKDFFVILDVDRTIINGTSWFKACSTEDMILDLTMISKFLRLNEMAFKEKSISKSNFRNQTLSLINESNTSIEELYVAGGNAVKQMIVYEDFVNYINLLKEEHGNKLKIIFLSSGYYPFIKGVIDWVNDNYFKSLLKYSLIASQIDVRENYLYESYFISQFQKQEIVEYFQENNMKIILLADDSTENMDLFKCVRKKGGKAIVIDYKNKQVKSKSWKQAIDDYIKSRCKENDLAISGNLNKGNVEFNNYFLDFLELNTDEIGICKVEKQKYLKGLANIMKGLSFRDAKNLEENLSQMFYFDKDYVFLRGEMFYYWVPTYIFINTKTYEESYGLLLEKSLETAKLITKIEGNIDLMGDFYMRSVIFAIIDHIQHALLIVLNMNEKANICGEFTLTEENNLNIVIQEVTNMLFDCLEGRFFISEFSKVIDRINIDLLNKNFKENLKFHNGMRELDNIVSIYKSVKLISESKKFKSLDYIVSLPYGGIGLGFSLIAYAIGRKIDKVPVVLNCHYSSKQELRKDFSGLSRRGMLDKIPSSYITHVNKIKKGNSNILIYDNNSTTLKTLRDCKEVFQKYNNIVQCAVVSFNYRNLAGYLSGNTDCETMDSDWEDILDFEVVEEYLTAYNTWGTSQKSEIIEKNYWKPRAIDNIFEDVSFNIRDEKIFKLCRVHNIVDYHTAIKNGVNMIGIHAVYTDVTKYRMKESMYSPDRINRKMNNNLPLSYYEIASISELAKNMDANIKVALILEKKLTIEEIRRCIHHYGLNKNIVSIQLQYRTTLDEITKIKSSFSGGLICTIGANQLDFEEYIKFLNGSLDEKKDNILIDFSKHQPDFIRDNKEDVSEELKEYGLSMMLPILKNNKI